MTDDLRPASKLISRATSAWFSRRRFLRSGGMMLVLRAAKLKGAELPLLAPPELSEPCLAPSDTLYPPLLASFIAKLDPAADTFVCEQHAAKIQPVLNAWSKAVCSWPRRAEHDTDTISLLLDVSLSASPMSPSETTTLRSAGPLRIERRMFGAVQAITADEFKTQIKEYFAHFAVIESFTMEIYGLRVAPASRSVVDTDVRYNIVAMRADGAREQRVGSWKFQWDTGSSGRPSITRWGIEPETRSILHGPGFTEITDACLIGSMVGMAQLLPGIDEWRSRLDGATGIDVYGNHGIAVGDIDGSGYDSFYVCQPSGLPNRLYRNRGDGSFEDITETSGAGILDGTASALFADFQNRGRQDLLVVRTGGVLLFENMGNGTYEPRPDAFQFARPPQGTFTSAAVADYNRDGLLDVYLCVYSYYKGLTHHQFPAPYYDAQNGPPNFLFRNRGDGTFEDVTAASGMDQNNDRFSFAAAWCDFDNDGWQDIYVANDFGRKNLYRNNRDGTFTDIAAKASVEDYGPGMSVCWLDHDNDGLEDIYVANMWLAEGQRITADAQFLPQVGETVRAIYRKHNVGNSLYRNQGAGTFADHSSTAGSAKCGWSWSCASWDFDNDGWSDLYVANGFVSAPNRHDLQSFFWRQVAQRSATAAGTNPDYELAWNAINELVRSGYSWSGYQRNVFFANNRDGTFSEVSGALGLDLIDDARAYSLSDFDHDGRLEFVIKNRTGPQLRVMRNDLESIGNSVAIRLTGHTSNRDAIGATVTLNAGGTRQSKFVAAGSGFASQHTKELHFGIGDTNGEVAVEVRWPTGKVERFQRLPINHRVLIDEGFKTFKAQPYKAKPPYQKVNAALPAVLASKSGPVGTWLVAPLFGPDLELPDLRGQMHRLIELSGQQALLTFLKPDCSASRSQLEELSASATAIAAAGLALFIVAVSEDNNRSALEALISSVRGAPTIHLADEKTVGAWNIQYRYLFDQRRDMEFPMSFLLDAAGAVVRVYRGTVDAQTLFVDVRSAPKTVEERFAKAMPFVGPYYGSAMRHDYLSFGIAFSEYGYDEAAEKAFLRAIADDPAHQVAWFNLGTIYLNRKMYPEARKYLDEAVRLSPLDADALNNLGSISGTEQKYDEAIDEFRRAALANPGHLIATENMMRIYQFQGKAAEAQKALEELIARAPAIAEFHLDLSMTLVAQNDLKRAREELETSLRLKPNYPDALNNLGAVLLKMGLPDDALQKFEQCRRIAPDFDRAAINAAAVNVRKGQPDQARAVLTEFLARHPDNAEVLKALERLKAR